MTAALRMKVVLKTSQGCHTCNQTTQHQEVKRPVVRFLQVPLMKRKFFRVGQVNRSKLHPLPSGHGPLAYLPIENSSTCLYRGSRQKKDNEAPHINDGSSPLSVFLLYFVEIITLLVVETNRYYHDHLDRIDEGPSPLPDTTEAETLVFLAITIQMEHCIWDKLTD